MSSPAPSTRWPKILARTVVVLVVLAGLGWGGRILWRQVSPTLFGNKREDEVNLQIGHVETEV